MEAKGKSERERERREKRTEERREMLSSTDQNSLCRGELLKGILSIIPGQVMMRGEERIGEGEKKEEGRGEEKGRKRQGEGKGEREPLQDRDLSSFPYTPLPEASTASQ
jgi:hypothetical protein